MRGVGVSRLAAKLSSAPLPDYVEPIKAQLVDRRDPATGFMKSNSTVAVLWRFAAAVRASPIADQEHLGKKFTNIRESIAALGVQDANCAASRFTPHPARSSLLRGALRSGIKTALPRGDLRFGDTSKRRTGQTAASEDESNRRRKRPLPSRALFP
jgi:hypothetical protein